MMSDVLGVFFFFNDTATTEIYTYLHTLSLHDALPISIGIGHPSEIEFPFAEKRRLPGRRRRETLQSRDGGCIVGGGITRLGEGEDSDQRSDGDMPDCCLGVWMRVRHETYTVGRGLICAERKRGVEGKRGVVRIDVGGRRRITKKI